MMHLGSAKFDIANWLSSAGKSTRSQYVARAEECGFLLPQYLNPIFSFI